MKTSTAASADAMEALGRRAGTTATAGSVYALVGGLGAGKTHWTKGFVAGAGGSSPVTSPTFGLVHRYDGAPWPIHHFDFYRLATAGEVLNLGWDEYTESEAVLVVEWADLFSELLPDYTHWIRFLINIDGSRVLMEDD